MGCILPWLKPLIKIIVRRPKYKTSGLNTKLADLNAIVVKCSCWWFSRGNILKNYTFLAKIEW
jgi:hypothetical protein